MRRRRSILLPLSVGLLLALVPTAANALTLSASSAETGWIAVTVVDAAPGPVTLREDRAGTMTDVATLAVPMTGMASSARVLSWKCEPRTRQLSAVDSSGMVASTSITTPSCRKRMAARVTPGKTRAGRKAVIAVRDLWRLGDVSVRACHTPAGLLGKECSSIPLTADGTWRKRSVLLKRPGRWQFKLTLPGATVKRTVKAKPRSGRLRVLAAGDSMIQYVDLYLKQKLKRITLSRLRSDDHISTGISKPQLFNWPRRAASTARSYKPDVTVMFIGANDGFNMTTPGGGSASCCGEAWVEEYARRVRAMMRDYERGGAAHVYWLLLPAARGSSFNAIFRRVNQAILRAAAESETTHVVDLRRTFTPGGRFRQSIRWRGRSVNVRAADGVHLNPAGAKIAAELVARRLRSDGVAVR